MQQASDRGTMDIEVTLAKFNTKFIERQVAVLRHALAYPLMMIGKLAATARPPLRFCCQRTSVTVQVHQVVHKTRRHPEVARCLAVAVPFLNKRHNTFTQSHRMWSSHVHAPWLPKENHTSADLGILNRINRDVL